MLTFRNKIKQGDPEAIRAIAASTGFFDEEDIQLNYKLANKALRSKDCGHEYLMAEYDGEPIAYVCFGELLDARDGTYEIFWLSTLERFRGCGIGRQLINALTDELKKRGINKLYVKTDSTEQYLPTRKFYEKCGFNQEAVLKGYYSDRDDCFIYSLNFVPEPSFIEEGYYKVAE